MGGGETHACTHTSKVEVIGERYTLNASARRTAESVKKQANGYAAACLIATICTTYFVARFHSLHGRAS
jgi:hypothetical protein